MKPEDLAHLVSEADPSELPRLIGDLEAARAIAWSRLTAPAPVPSKKAGPLPLHVSVAEAAKALGVSRQWLYHAKDLPFIRRLGRRVVRHRVRALRRWIDGRKPLGPHVAVPFPGLRKTAKRLVADQDRPLAGFVVGHGVFGETGRPHRRLVFEPARAVLNGPVSSTLACALLFPLRPANLRAGRH